MLNYRGVEKKQGCSLLLHDTKTLAQLFKEATSR